MIDPAMLHAWLAARSLARGLPAPVPNRGGYRVDTGSETEVRRWVFPRMCSGLVQLTREIEDPREFVKLCGTVDELATILPERWIAHSPSYVMSAGEAPSLHRPPPGYELEVERSGAVTEARILAPSGELAARGYAAEIPEAFVYDRIITAPEHRRRGLGGAIMCALRQSRRSSTATELLVATEPGRALYETLGWKVISPYATASIDVAEVGL